MRKNRGMQRGFRIVTMLALLGVCAPFGLASNSTTLDLDSRDYELTVSSAQGNPSPAVGTHSNYAWRSAVSCSVASPVSGVGSSYQCTGWTGTGAVPATGATNQTGSLVLSVPTSSIAWNWSEQVNTYPVSFDLDGKGTRSGGGATNQSTDHGSAATAPSVLANTGWRFLDWDVAFDQITGSLTVTAQYVEEFTLTVSSPSGNPSPETSVYTNGSVVNCSIEAIITNAANTVRSQCFGWQMAGQEPSTGDTNYFSMTITDDATLDWLWITEYWLNTETNGNGSVDVSDGWNNNGSFILITATPADGASFTGWSGDVSPQNQQDNPLLTMMNQARVITANFVALPDLMLTNALYTSNTYLIGSSLAVSVVETNRGAANAGAFSLVGVLSTNAVWDNANNIVLGTNTTASLAAGAGVAVTPVYTVPNAAEGFYYFGLKVDALGAVGESDELNNVWWSSTNDVGVSKAPMWSVNPAETNLPGAAANGAFAVVQTQGLDAAWSAEVSKDWISLVPAFTNGLGDGEVRYSVLENASGINRDGVIVAAGASFAVSQNTLLPNAPMNPAPANGLVGADRDVTLVWENGGRALDYDVFFGNSEGAMRFASEIVATSLVAGAESDYQIGTREADQTCFWQVIAHNEGGSTTGAVWRFTTMDRMTEDESLNTAGQGLDWERGGDTPWFSQDVETHDGDNAMQSGAIANDQQASMQAVLEGPGVLSFWSKVSSETSDALTFSVNDVPQTNWSGEADWAQTQVAVDFGSQTAKWVYAKDGTGSAGSDAAWVDEVDWAGENKVVFPLSDFSNWVATYIWDYTNQEWIEMGQSFAPTSVEFDNARQDRWYWLCVMEWNGTSWSLAHGSWFKRFEGY